MSPLILYCAFAILVLLASVEFELAVMNQICPRLVVEKSCAARINVRKEVLSVNLLKISQPTHLIYLLQGYIGHLSGYW
jgi:hypothetical protein